MQKIRFGDMELEALFALEESEEGVLTIGEIAERMRLSKEQAWKLASRLVRKNRLIRLKRGVYLFAPMKAGRKGLWTEDAIATIPKLMEGKEYYIGFWSALSHYGLTEQVPVTVQIVTTSRQRTLEALQTRFEFTQVRRLGEWRDERVGENMVRIATLEQLLLDCLSLPEKSGGIKEACKALWNARKKLDWKKLEALTSSSSDAARRRLGYLSELLGMRKLKPGEIVGWRWLDPSAPKRALNKSVKWGLLLNISEKELLEWRDQ